MGLQRAGSELAIVLEQLSDHDLAEGDREERTVRLYAALTDIRVALTKVGEGADADTDTLDRAGVVVVAGSRWRRQGWGRAQ
jgi:hypothetical protein